MAAGGLGGIRVGVRLKDRPVKEVQRMPEDVIDMSDMAVIFAVTDAMGIHRESVRVELGKEDPGSIGKDSGGLIEITVPESQTIKEFCGRLESELKEMGYIPQDPAAGSEEDEDEDSWL